MSADSTNAIIDSRLARATFRDLATGVLKILGADNIAKTTRAIRDEPTRAFTSESSASPTPRPTRELETNLPEAVGMLKGEGLHVLPWYRPRHQPAYTASKLAFVRKNPLLGPSFHRGDRPPTLLMQDCGGDRDH
ncbi:hypothetical protein [Streptomyces sp. 2A115]|uniref:hypothetical protein n=1 Tax=Streptomyces sp. 2A115 TaxID=3457439 RepID=UPI003FD41F24